MKKLLYIFIILLITIIVLVFYTRRLLPLRSETRSKIETDINEVSVGYWLHPQEYQNGSYKDYSDYSSNVTSITINWGTLEPERGKFNWDRLHRYVGAIREQNPKIKILLHVRSLSEWAVEKPCDQFNEAEMPAIEMRDWENFISNLSAEFKGEIQAYALSNEAAAPQNWGGCDDARAGSYFEMLRVLSDSVKSVDKKAYITNDGISSGVLVYAYGYHGLYKVNKEASVNFFNEATKSHIPSGFREVYNTQSIEKLHADYGVKYMDPFWEGLIQNQDAVDFVSLHWFQPANSLLEVMPWVQKQFPGKPLQLWETSYGWDQTKVYGQSYKNYDSMVQASEIAKLLTIGTAYGNWVQLWPWTSIVEDEGKFPTGSVDISGDRAVFKDSAVAYRVIAENLEGSTFESIVTIPEAPNAKIFKYIKGKSAIYIMWSEQTQNIDISKEVDNIHSIVGLDNIEVANKYPHFIELSTTPVILITE